MDWAGYLWLSESMLKLVVNPAWQGQAGLSGFKDEQDECRPGGLLMEFKVASLKFKGNAFWRPWVPAIGRSKQQQ